MARIRCFFLEPTGRVSVRLRRYASADLPCPYTRGYHDASVTIGEADDLDTNWTEPEPSHEDSRWPSICSCGYAFSELDTYQRFVQRLYRRVDTGEEMTLRDAPPGAMWYADWLDWAHVPQLEHNLVVRTPGGEWDIDSQASNCTIPEDSKQEKHHCWIIHGQPPDITVDKAGVTCLAGAGSIQCGDYHGFLRNGYLED